MLDNSNIFGLSNIFDSSDKDCSIHYYLMNRDTKVLKFDSNYDVVEGYKILEIYNKEMIPFSCKNNLNYFSTWLGDRPIANNQEHLNNLLKSLQMDSRQVIDLLKVNNGFSLNDCYWICPVIENEFNIKMDWKSNNLYENEFDEALGLITFFGNESSLGGTIRTPEITNQGSVGKAWRKINNRLILYKKTSEGAANLGKEHYAEVLASKVLDIIGLEHVEYWSDSWHGKECSCCEIFTDSDNGYLPMYQYLNGLNININDWTYVNVLNSIPSIEDRMRFNDMVVFDFIIENWDRHFANFGFIIDNTSQKIKKFAPIFDNGYSLMCRDLESDFVTRDYLSYSKVNTFKLVTNKDVASFVIKQNPSRYKSWSKKIMTNLDRVRVDGCPSWYLRGVLHLIISRCRFIRSL